MTRTESLPQFLRAVADLLDILNRGREVLFREPFRQNLPEVMEDTNSRLREMADRLEYSVNEYRESLYLAGLSDHHLQLKLESFDSALQSFRDTAREDKLEESLEKAKTILGSLAGAIPGFGSFAQELIDFILKEIKRRLLLRR